MKELYQKYQAYWPAAFFVGGFAFDLLTTDRIDHGLSLIQQLAFLLLIMIFSYWELVTPKSFLVQQSWRFRFWRFHVEALHFLFGCLLSLYTIFYFKSASIITSSLFLFLLVVLLVFNELPQFQKQGLVVRASMLALCLSSYFIYLVPVVSGEIGLLPFLISMALSMALFYLLGNRLRHSVENQSEIDKKFLLPGLIVQLSFVLLYFLKVLPPVPLSLKFVGIYHEVKKEANQYVLNYERPWWAFWQKGAQTFIRREGDRVYCFVSIFSPTQFKTKINLTWHHYSKNKWKMRDQVSLNISGGRDAGFRGYAYKSNFEEGDWQVRVMTQDQRELGRISFSVSPGASDQPREFKSDLF